MIKKIVLIMLFGGSLLPLAQAAENNQDKDWEKLNEILTKEVSKDNQKNGRLLAVQRVGNFTYVGPSEETHQDLSVQKIYYASSTNLYSEIFRDKNSRQVMKKKYYFSGELDYEVKTLNDRDELITSYYKNGNIISKGLLRNNRQAGIHRDYYKYGKVQTETFFKTSGKFSRKDYSESGRLVLFTSQNVTKSYGEDGTLRDFTVIKPDEDTQVRRSFYGEGGIKELSTRNVKTNEGHTKQFYKNGNLSGEFLFKESKLISIKKYDKNGKVIFSKTASEMESEEKIYKAGQRNGKLLQCVNSGLLEEAVYSNGKMTSRILYNQNGDIIQDQNTLKGYWRFYYDNGNLMMDTEPTPEVNLHKSFSESGKLQYESNEEITQGKTQKKRDVFYHENGSIKQIRIADSGRLINRKEYDDTGKLLVEQDIKNGPVDLM